MTTYAQVILLPGENPQVGPRLDQLGPGFMGHLAQKRMGQGGVQSVPGCPAQGREKSSVPQDAAVRTMFGKEHLAMPLLTQLPSGFQGAPEGPKGPSGQTLPSPCVSQYLVLPFPKHIALQPNHKPLLPQMGSETGVTHRPSRRPVRPTAHRGCPEGWLGQNHLSGACSLPAAGRTERTGVSWALGGPRTKAVAESPGWGGSGPGSPTSCCALSCLPAPALHLPAPKSRFPVQQVPCYKHPAPLSLCSAFGVPCVIWGAAHFPSYPLLPL